MKRSKIYLFILCFLFFSAGTATNDAESAVFNDAADGLWNIGTTWGGGCAAACTEGADYPGSADDAVIDSHTVTLADNLGNVRNLTISGGTFAGSSYTFTISGNWNYTGGTWSRGTSEMIFTGTGPAVITGATTYAKLTIASGANVRADNNLSHRNLLNISGTLEISAGTKLTGSGGTPEITIGATGLLKGAGTYDIYYTDGKNPVINGSIAIANFQFRAIWGTNTNIPLPSVRYGVDSPSPPTYATNVIIFAHSDCTNHSFTPTAGTLQIDGDFIIAYDWVSSLCSGNSVTVDNTTNNASIIIGGDLIIGDSSGTTQDSSTLITGNADVTVGGSVTIYSSGSGTNTIDASGMSGKTLSVAGNWDSSGGTFTYGTSTVVIGTNSQTNTLSTPDGGPEFYVLEIASGATINAQTSFTINDNFNIKNSATFNIASGKTVTHKNNEVLTIESNGILAGAGTFIQGLGGGTGVNSISGRITVATYVANSTPECSVVPPAGPVFTGAHYEGDVVLRASGNDIVSCMHIDGGDLEVDGTLTISMEVSWGTPLQILLYNDTENKNVTVGNLVIGNSGNADQLGKFVAGSGNIIINGDVTIYNGGGINNEIDADTSSWSVGGNWTNNDIFNPGTGSTVEFTGAGTSTITGNTTFYNLSSTTAGKQLTFTAGSNQTVNNLLTLTGTVGNEILLRSSGASAYTLTFPNGAQTVSGVDVEYSTAATNGITANSSINSGNNTNWTFDPVTRYWVGTADGEDWDDNNNWASTSGGTGGADYPQAGDAAVFDGSNTTNITLDNPVSIDTITNTGGYTGTFTTSDNAVTVTGDFRFDGGTFTAGASIIDVSGDFDISGITLFNENTSTVIMRGAGPNYIRTKDNEKLYHLTIATGADIDIDVPATITVSRDMNIDGTLTVPASKTLDFFSLTTLTIGAAGVLDGAGEIVTYLLNNTPRLVNNNPSAGIQIGTYEYNQTWTTSGSRGQILATTYGGNLEIVANWASDTNEYAEIYPAGQTLSVGGDLIIRQMSGGDTESMTLDNSANNNTIIITGDLIMGNAADDAALSFITGSGTTTVGGNIIISDDIDSNNLNIIDASGTGTINVAGSWTNNDTFTSGSGTVIFNSGATGRTITSGGSPFYNIEFNNASGGWTLQDTLTTGNNFTLTDSDTTGSGVDLNSQTVSVTGDFLINGGKVTAGNANVLTVGGNWDSSGGTYNPLTNNTVFFTGPGDQTITSGGSVFYNLTLNNPGSSFIINDDMDIDGTLTITAGDMDLVTANPDPDIKTAGNISIDTNGSVTSGTGTWTFDGASNITDNSSTGPQNLGTVVVD